jgi:hypothetical protein
MKVGSGLMLALRGFDLTVRTPIEIVRRGMAEASALVSAIDVALGCLLFRLGSELMHRNHLVAQPLPAYSVSPSPRPSRVRTTD